MYMCTSVCSVCLPTCATARPHVRPPPRLPEKSRALSTRKDDTDSQFSCFPNAETRGTVSRTIPPIAARVERTEWNSRCRADVRRITRSLWCSLHFSYEEYGRKRRKTERFVMYDRRFPPMRREFFLSQIRFECKLGLQVQSARGT